MVEDNSIGLALSGGGVRAMAFHAGVLLYLSEGDYFERVSHISSVSGGSLLVGIIYGQNGNKWPTSYDYKSQIFQSIKNLLCITNLQLKLGLNLLFPANWQYCLSRANILAKVLESEWGIKGYLSELNDFPIWSINGTTAENGKRFRFKSDTFGDYSLGYCTSDKILLTQALAISAAFPGGIGPLVIKSKEYVWKKRPWGAPLGSEIEIELEHKKLHIYDGGVYDNLGSESLFDPGKGAPKYENLSIIVSDAGSPLEQGFGKGPFNPFRLKRILDITMEQARALRVRSLMTYLTKYPREGAYLMIGQHPSNLLGDQIKDPHIWQSENTVESASNYGTNLLKMRGEDFEKISRHGYESIKAAELRVGERFLRSAD